MTTKQEWLEQTYKSAQERPVRFTTLSDMAVDPLYTPDDLKGDYDSALGYPGASPYTRGVYESMYRGRLWTMRQFAGYGLAEDTNKRFHFLLSQGQDGLSTAFDMPTLMGYDPDSGTQRSARSAEKASRSARFTIWRPCSTRFQSAVCPPR